MTPYYDHAGITIYHGDCRDILPQLEPVDLVLTDPPYGVGCEYESFDDSLINTEKLIHETWTLILNAGKTCVASVGIKTLRFFPTPRWICIMHNPAGSMFTPLGMGCWQPILFYGKSPSEKISDVFTFNERSQRFGHPCSKPIKLWTRILKSFDGETVLDPFMGSGTTLVAAKQLNRKAIGIEIEEKYCEIAVKRLQQEVFDFSEAL